MITRILICDDRKEGCEGAERHLKESDCEVNMLHGKWLKQALEELFRSTDKIFQLDKVDSEQQVMCKKLTGCELAIVDNNLAELDFGGVRLTAESVIGRIRAFTDIDYIVSLNKNPNVDFDLRHLFGDHESVADLALNTKHLSNHRLWRESYDADFAPWYWPCLPEAAGKRRDQIAFVRDNLDASIWEALDFPDSATEYLSRRAKGALGPTANDEGVRSVTFRDFFKINRSLPPKMRDDLLSLANDDVPLAVRAISRVASAELDRWLRREVLAPQDVLIDLPHLLSRMPHLLGGTASELSAWNDAIKERQPPYGLDKVLYERYVKEAEFHSSCWTPSPCFWWPKLDANDQLRRLFFESEDDWPDAVFCEDVSMFLTVKSDTCDSRPKEFEADIEGSWPRRYISMRATDVSFSPQSRIVG
ncbi:MAG: hypothetical protein F4149_10085 [Gammaproteobacteria bacterium]|nr:hypothetical protein [Gammaproteobacteria bacterium]